MCDQVVSHAYRSGCNPIIGSSYPFNFVKIMAMRAKPVQKEIWKLMHTMYTSQVSDYNNAVSTLGFFVIFFYSATSIPASLQLVSLSHYN